MDHLLFLAHRIPFPPDKGDKIRSWHLLKHLAKTYRVHLATFIDDEDDWRHVDTVKKICGDTFFAQLAPRTARVCSLTALATNQPLTLAYYRNAAMQRWITELKQRYSIDRIVVFSSAMAQFVPLDEAARCVIDFVDVDSDKWAQYALRKPWPASLIYRREAHQLRRYEREVAARFAASLFVSSAEADLFRRLAPESSERIGHFSNGVDTDYFSPAHLFVDPFVGQKNTIVFTGAMDYWPNIDAVVWFADEVLPAILRRIPTASFYIVGSKPSSQVQDLARRPGICVTGRVEDVRPYLAYASVAVAPLRIARGIQNKVLEAMAMARAVFVTPQALEGIAAQPDEEVMLANHAQELQQKLIEFLLRPDPAIGIAARKLVDTKYGWAAHLAMIDQCLASPTTMIKDGCLA